MEKQGVPKLGCGYAFAGFLFAAGAALVGLADQIGARVIGLVLLIGAIGYGVSVRRIVAKAEAAERRKVEFAKEPWKIRKEWLGAAIESDDHKGVWGLVIFALVWNAFTLPMTWMVFADPKVEPAAFMVVIFPLAGLGILAAAGYQVARRRKFGRTRFVPTSVPGVIGGYLGGVIEVPARVVAEADARVALKCIRRVTTGSGKQRRTSETVLWEREERIPPERLQAGGARTDIPVLFYIPEGQPQSDWENANNQIVWRLTAQAEVPGVDFDTKFSVPVFATGETAPPPSAQEPLLDAYRVGRLEEREMRSSGITTRADGFGFDASHLWGARAVFTLINAGLLGGLVVLMLNDGPVMAWVVMGVITLFVLMITWDLWRSGFDVRIHGDEVVVRQPGGAELRVPRARGKEVRVDKGITIGTTQYYKLVLVGSEGLPEEAARPGETFKARKLRSQWAKSGGSETLRARMAEEPGFEIVFAKHVPGSRVAADAKARVEALVLGRG